MTEIELLADLPVERGARLNPKTCQALHRDRGWFQDANATPPVVVLRADGGFVLADGCHRPETAERRGATSIRAGSLSDALRYASWDSVRPT